MFSEVAATAFLPAPVCKLPGSLQGKVAVITGCNTGIGLETLAELARRGAHVIMACRNVERAEKAKATVLERYGESSGDAWQNTRAGDTIKQFLMPIKPEQLVVEQLELASLDNVRQFAERILPRYPKIHYLINNAGVWNTKYETTVDGFEMTIGVNHLGHVLLNELLLPAIKAAAPSRIIVVSSMGHRVGDIQFDQFQAGEQSFRSFAAYCQSKLANVLYARSLAKRLADTGVLVASLHPGAVKTELFRQQVSLRERFNAKLMSALFITPWLGAQTTLHTVLADDLQSGGYYSACKLVESSAKAQDDALAEKLWATSRQLVGLDES